MIKLVDVAEMQTIEKEADKGGLSYEDMMENAGRGLAQVVHEKFMDIEDRSILGLIGSGNNGGDTLVALTYLSELDWKTSAYILRKRSADDPLIKRFQEGGGEIHSLEKGDDFSELGSLVETNRVVLDGVLGTGIKLPLRGKLAEGLEAVRQSIVSMDNPPLVIAVDCPSGVDCDTGEAAPECIPADLTVTMAAVKIGLLTPPASQLIGELHVVPIGLKDEKSWKEVNKFVADFEEVQASLPDRPVESHKGTFGTTLILAGSINFTGAALLAGKAAYRVGTGLVTLGIPAPLHAALAGHFPEATWLLLPNELGAITEDAVDILSKNLDRPTAMLIGPGFGLEEVTKDFLASLFGVATQIHRGSIGFIPSSRQEAPGEEQSLPPLVIDADALKLLAEISDWESFVPAPAVLTPHPGEMAIMTDLSIEEIQSDRLKIAQRFAKEWGHIVVLKGAHTVVAAPDGRVTVIPIATAALARAGTGDVLAGLIVGLRAQGVEAYQAAVSGCWIHGQAGIQSALRLGTTASVLAGDVLDAVAGVMGDLYKKK